MVWAESAHRSQGLTPLWRSSGAGGPAGHWIAATRANGESCAVVPLRDGVELPKAAEESDRHKWHVERGCFKLGYQSENCSQFQCRKQKDVRLSLGA